MTETMSPNEWLNKVDYEGGILDGLDYGLSEHFIDGEKYPHFHELVRTARIEYDRLLDTINEIEDYEGEDTYND